MCAGAHWFWWWWPPPAAVLAQMRCDSDGRWLLPWRSGDRNSGEAGPRQPPDLGPPPAALCEAGVPPVAPGGTSRSAGDAPSGSRHAPCRAPTRVLLVLVFAV